VTGIPVFELVGLAFIGAAVWFWLDILKSREIGIRAARAACDSEQLQLLDDTVAIASLRPTRNDDGQLVLQRVYAFEYSDTGNNRRRGSVVLLGHRVIVVNIGLRLVPSERTLH
jgi:hypothetical protein